MTPREFNKMVDECIEEVLSEKVQRAERRERKAMDREKRRRERKPRRADVEAHREWCEERAYKLRWKHATEDPPPPPVAGDDHLY